VAGYRVVDLDGWISPIASADERTTAAIARDLLARFERGREAPGPRMER
jgi:hypothetical protein